MEKVSRMTVDKSGRNFCLYKTSGLVAFVIACVFIARAQIDYYNNKANETLDVAAATELLAKTTDVYVEKYKKLNSYFWVFEESDRVYYANMCKLFMSVTHLRCPIPKSIDVIGVDKP